MRLNKNKKDKTFLFFKITYKLTYLLSVLMNYLSDHFNNNEALITFYLCES